MYIEKSTAFREVVCLFFKEMKKLASFIYYIFTDHLSYSYNQYPN